MRERFARAHDLDVWYDAGRTLCFPATDSIESAWLCRCSIGPETLTGMLTAAGSKTTPKGNERGLCEHVQQAGPPIDGIKKAAAQRDSGDGPVTTFNPMFRSTGIWRPALASIGQN